LKNDKKERKKIINGKDRDKNKNKQNINKQKIKR